MGMPWEEFLVFYNKRENTTYATVKDWITALYKAADGYVHPVAELIGVSSTTMTRKLKELNIYQRKSVRRNVNQLGDKEKLYLAIPDDVFINMTRKQIAERCGCHIDTFTKLNRKYKRPYHRLQK